MVAEYDYYIAIYLNIYDMQAMSIERCFQDLTCL